VRQGQGCRANAAPARGRLHRTASALLTALVAVSAALGVRAEEAVEVDLNPGDLRASIYVPDTLPERPALVVALHGCGQGASDYDDETGWTALADELQFIVLFPEQDPINNVGRCFNWMMPGDRVGGQGEPESIKQMIDAVVHKHSVDDAKVFITGLSAGGAMTAVMLAAYPEVFAGGAIIAGLPYLCVSIENTFLILVAAVQCMERGNEDVTDAVEWGNRVRAASEHQGPAWPRVSIWHGVDDLIVDPVNAQNLMEQWTNVHGIDQTPEIDESVAGHRHRVYGTGPGQVETFAIEGMGHAVPIDPDQGCGIDRVEASVLPFADNDYVADAGICSSRRIAQFWGLSE